MIKNQMRIAQDAYTACIKNDELDNLNYTNHIKMLGIAYNS